MKLYLMRHGDAVTTSEWPMDDASRPLASHGEAKLNTAVKKMQQIGFQAQTLLTSPFARTRQTADIINHYYPQLEPTIVDEFASGSTLAKLKAGVEKFNDKESLWIVGHMPDMAILGSRVTSVAAVMERSLAPGEILALETDFPTQGWGDGKVLWYRTLEQWSALTPFDL